MNHPYIYDPEELLQGLVPKLENIKGLGPKKIESLRKALTRKIKADKPLLFFDLMKTKGLGLKFLLKTNPLLFSKEEELQRANILALSFSLVNSAESQGQGKVNLQTVLEEGVKQGLLFTKSQVLSCLSWASEQKIIDFAYNKYICRQGQWQRAQSVQGLLENLYLQSKKIKRPNPETLNEIFNILNSENFKYSKEQAQCIYYCLAPGLHCVAAEAGTGKTEVLKGILNMTLSRGRSVLVLSPTISSRLNIRKRAGYRSETVASFLKSPSKVRFDFVVIDEASLMDESSFFSLCRHFNKETSLCLIGDIYQMPSVRPGRVLHDLIKKYPQTHLRLHQNYRTSSVACSAMYRHLRLNFFVSKSVCHSLDSHDVQWVKTDPDPIKVLMEVQKILNESKFIKSAAVITPKNSGTLGVENLTALNETLFHMNNVEFFTPSKSQGLQFDLVIPLLFEAHNYFLERSSVYTSITRTKKKIVFLSDRDYVKLKRSPRKSLIETL